MTKKITIVALVAMMLLTAVLPASAAINASKVEIRGDVSKDTTLDDTGTEPFSVMNWNSANFAGFWYDLKEDSSSENLQISARDGRSIDKENLWYNTTPAAKKFKVLEEKSGQQVSYGLDYNSITQKFTTTNETPGGQYYALVGWQAEKYVALNGKPNKLAKLVMEQDTTDKRTLTIGDTWDMGDGYTLSAQSVDAKASPRKAWLVLSKDGTKLDDKVTNDGTTYTYFVENLLGESKVPIFVAYIDSIFAGQTTDMVQIKYAWLISKSSAIEVKSGDKYGIFKVDKTDPTLVLKSDSSITLSSNSIVDLAGNLKFRVADDSKKLRFYPMVERTSPGKYEVRGTVSKDTTLDDTGTEPFSVMNWNSTNFAGFWYDLKEDISSENLQISARDGRSIDKENLWYNTTPAAKKFKVLEEKSGQQVSYGLDYNSITQKFTTTNETPGGQYYALVGWQAEKYVALNGKPNKLAKLVMEQDTTDKRTLTIGDTWDMGDGYTLSAQSVDAKASPRKAWLVLSKDGTKLDDKVTNDGTTYTYFVENLLGESKVPIFVAYIDSIFAGQTTDMVQIKYAWLISKSSAIEVKSGDKYGIFKVDKTDPTLVLKSDSSITLSSNSIVDLAGNLKFRVADDSKKLRFYPMVEYVIGGVTPTPSPGTPIVGATTGKPVVNVTTPRGNETVPPTQNATAPPAAATTKKTEPGFEAIFAIAGLLAVAFLVLRQRK